METAHIYAPSLGGHVFIEHFEGEVCDAFAACGTPLAVGLWDALQALLDRHLAEDRTVRCHEHYWLLDDAEALEDTD